MLCSCGRLQGERIGRLASVLILRRRVVGCGGLVIFDGSSLSENVVRMRFRRRVRDGPPLRKLVANRSSLVRIGLGFH